MNFRKITFKNRVQDYLQTVEEKSLIIYSETSIIKNNIFLNKTKFDIYSTKTVTKQKNKIDKCFSNLNKYSKIIAIGGGTAIDIGKYIAHRHNKELICIPTMLSTNAYATNKVALIVNDKKTTLDSSLPTKILFDEKMLNNSKEFNVYGMADIFSIFTALNDWKLAVKYNNESLTSEFYDAQKLLNLTLEYVEREEFFSLINNCKMIYDLVGEAGEITNQYGSGKPESGSEHIFAKELEHIVNVPHAIAVANGIIIMSIAQQLFMQVDNIMDIYNSLTKLKIYDLNKKYEIDYNLLTSVLMNLKPREDRFTVINLIYSDNLKIQQILLTYKEKFKL